MIFQENRPAVGDATSPPAQVSFTPALIGSAIVAALGGFLFGFDTAVISGTTEALKTTFRLNENLLGFTVAIALIGTIIGSIFAGKPADIWGRKRALMVLAVLYFVGRSAALWPGIGIRFSPSGCWVDWRSAVRRSSRLCTSPRFLRRGFAAVLWRLSSSTLCWAFSSRSCRTT